VSILADTSGILVLLDADDPQHAAASRYIGELVLPVSVLCEVDYLATARLGPHVSRRFFAGLSRGDMRVLEVGFQDMVRASEVMQTYADSEVGFVDASLVALAERYKLRRVLTLDKRHFSMFRPVGLDYLEILP
jgi:predicted nucleic acid-binding protein